MNPSKLVLSTCGWVMENAKHVKIDYVGLDNFANKMVNRTKLELPQWDGEDWHYSVDAQDGGPLTAQCMLVMDALNWCFWPSETALEYDSLAMGLRDVLKADPHAFDANRLAAVTEDDLKTWCKDHVYPNLPERARLVREVGEGLIEKYDGLALNMIKAANHSAVKLTQLVLEAFPGFRDAQIYKGRQIHFYKRAQIFVMDVWGAYGRQICSLNDAQSSEVLSPVSFYDVDQITCFADYRLPQILRSEVMIYAGEKGFPVPSGSISLAERVDNKIELPAGCEEEMEIRAATVIVVQRLRELLEEKMKFAGISTRSLLMAEVDWYLWQWGEETKDDLSPHHRANTIFY